MGSVVSRRGRLAVAALVGFSSLVPFIAERVDEAAGLIPVSMPFVAAVAIFLPRLGAQLLARAAWWSNLILGAILCAMGGRSDQSFVPFLVLGPGLALLIAGRSNVSQSLEQSRYSPASFQTTLLALMILALADASTLLLFGFLQSHLAPMLILVHAGAGLLVGFVGLLNVRFWGVLVNVAISAAIALAVVGDALPIDKDFGVPIAILGAIHVLVAAPMLVSIALRRPLPSLSPRAGAAVAAGVILFAMIVTTAAAWDRANFRGWLRTYVPCRGGEVGKVGNGPPVGSFAT